ncbi:mate family efflux transporter [Anaeramoeba ignava]|uniref:Mate family efflux transporter n=1 Tax=Anaeramoeba ignava TaxID=1746090 RepID=A0A9Q0RGF3_ANAIG|nr:mate family efflux transporter [Anaeramoeba ignava]
MQSSSETDSEKTYLIQKKQPMVNKYKEIRALLSLTFPLILENLAVVLFQSVNLVSLGHLGEEELAGCSLGSILWAISTMFPLGFVHALDAFISQAHGAKNERLVGVYVYQSYFIMIILAIPIAFLWYFSGSVMTALKQDHVVANYARKYLIWQMPGLVPFLFLSVIQECFQNLQIVIAPLVINLIGFGVNIFLNFGFVYGVFHLPKLGFIGSPIATSISEFIMFVLMYIYLKVKKIDKEWKLEKSVFNPLNLGPFLKVGLPIVFTMLIEELIYELTLFLAGAMGTIQMGVHTVLVNIDYLLYSIGLGFSVGVSTRIGYFLGSGDPISARLSTRCSYFIGFIIGAINSSIVISLRKHLGYIFSSSKTIINQVSQLAYYSAVHAFIDANYTTFEGIMRGIGSNVPGFLITFFGFLTISTTLSFVFFFETNLEVKGLWISIIVGISSSAIAVIFLFLRRVNWKKQSDIAVLRATHEWSSSSESESESESETETDEFISKSSTSSSTFSSESSENEDETENQDQDQDQEHLKVSNQSETSSLSSSTFSSESSETEDENEDENENQNQKIQQIISENDFENDNQNNTIINIDIENVNEKSDNLIDLNSDSSDSFV